MKTFPHFFLFPFFTLNLLLAPMRVDEARRIDDAALSVTTEQLAQIVDSFVADCEIVDFERRVFLAGRSVLLVRSVSATGSDCAPEKMNRHPTRHTVAR